VNSKSTGTVRVVASTAPPVAIRRPFLPGTISKLCLDAIDVEVAPLGAVRRAASDSGTRSSSHSTRRSAMWKSKAPSWAKAPGETRTSAIVPDTGRAAECRRRHRHTGQDDPAPRQAGPGRCFGGTGRQQTFLGDGLVLEQAFHAGTFAGGQIKFDLGLAGIRLERSQVGVAAQARRQVGEDVALLDALAKHRKLAGALHLAGAGAVSRASPSGRPRSVPVAVIAGAAAVSSPRRWRNRPSTAAPW
jgi:hypothetical protein